MIESVLVVGLISLLSAAPVEQPLKEMPYVPGLDLSAMDKTVDPCVDFYAYSCHGWEKANPIPPDQAHWSVYGKLQDETQRFLWGILAEASTPGLNRSAVLQKTGDQFAACMDEATIEKLGATPLAPALAAIAKIENKKDLASYLVSDHRSASDENTLFGLGSSQDPADATKVIAILGAGGLGLPDRDYYVKTDAKSVETREHYLAHLQAMFGLLGDSNAAEEAKTVLQLETELAKASLTRVERRDPYKVFHKMSRAKLVALTPVFDWSLYLSGMGVPAQAPINVTQPAFFKRMNELIASESLETWKTYLRWHLVAARAPYLSSPFSNASFAFYRKYLSGVEVMPPRWKRCVRWIDRDLGEALGQLFVEKTFSPQTKERTLLMTKAIQQEMERDLKSLSWMSPKTRSKALEKLKSMANKIGYPDRWRDYSALSIERGDFLGNVLRALEFENNRQIAKIGKPLDRGEWQMTPQTVNAYYDSQMNDMNFPAAVLMPPLYDAKIDDAPNYGNTGGTIGHELTHGFDDEGRQYDAKGNLSDWWTKADAAEFTRRATCVSDQYSQYIVVDDIKINGKLSLGEDVADLGGLILAYHAWQKVTENQRLKMIDGFTPEQRFFIGFAQWDCNNSRPEDERANAITNPHSPGRWRINGVAVNMPEFATAFSCKPDQPMVKPAKNICKVW